MAESIRVVYSDVKGRVRRNFNWRPIKKESAVIVTAAEWRSTSYGPELDGRPHLGDANVYVTNIGVHGDEGGGGGVEFYLHVDWHSPLYVIVTISVLEDVTDVVSEIGLKPIDSDR